MRYSALPVRHVAIVQGHDWTAPGVRSYRVRRVRCDWYTARLLQLLPTVSPA